MIDRTARPWKRTAAYGRHGLRGAIERLESRLLFAATTTVFQEAFEGDYLDGWTNRTDAGANGATRWGLNSVRAAAGGQSAFASALRGGVSAARGYQNDQGNTLVREDVSLAGLRVATLTFDYFLNTESGYDTFSVAVTDAAGSTTTLFSESGNFSGGGWRRKSLDLSQFAGRRDLDIEFRFVSDSSVTHDGGGVWIDEAKLIGESLVPTGSISGRLFDDADGDRVRDAGEGPLAGWVVYLDGNRNGSRDAGEPSRITDAAGNYTFDDLAAGTYHVAEQIPAGFAQTSPGAAGASSGSAFKIDLVFPDTTLSASQRVAFSNAARRWAQLIVGDLPDASDNGTAIDDIRIVATAPQIDGRGGVLGQASPTAFRSGSSLPYKGFMEFDAADVARLEADGQLAAVILHEMGHVLGFGTLWAVRNLLQGAGGDNPRYIGANAARQYNAIFNTTGGAVPVESVGGPGTVDSHWRDSTFGNELMTGFLNGGNNPISRVTVGAMADLGYGVSYSAADDYAPPGGSGAPAAGNGGLLANAHTVYVDAGQNRTGIDFGNRRTNRAPVVGAIAASPGAGVVGGAVTLTASGVGDPDGSVARVSFYRETNRTPGLQTGAGGDTLVGNDSSGADGYRVTTFTAGLAAGTHTYYARAFDNAGASSPSGTSAPAAVHTVAAPTSPDARGGAISGVVFEDRNGNGRRDSGEPGQAGWRVFVDANRNMRFDVGEKSIVTGAAGSYAFTGLAAGTHHVREVDVSGWARTAWSPVVTLTAGASAPGKNFANFRHASISGTVFNDADRDGARDAGDAGLAGVRVYDDKDGDGVYDAGERSTLTDGRGGYTLGGLIAGPRTIRIVSPPGRRLTAPSAGYHRVVPTSGQSVTGKTFAMTQF